MANILDGKTLATQIKETLRLEVDALKVQYGAVPCMVNILVGDDYGSSVYSKSQQKAAQQIGIDFKLVTLPANASQGDVLECIRDVNKDKNIHGLIIQNPLPKGIDYENVMATVNPYKDLEGINPVNLGNLLLDKPAFAPCTPAAVMEHLKALNIPLRGKEAVIIGVSKIVGKPLMLLLTKERATVTVCHSGTSDAGKLAEHIGRADIVVAAIGKANFIKGEWIKQGAVVIDVGINELNGKTVGDVDFESAKERAGYITPVPGGVGPVTVAMLMKNVVEAFKFQLKFPQTS